MSADFDVFKELVKPARPATILGAVALAWACLALVARGETPARVTDREAVATRHDEARQTAGFARHPPSPGLSAATAHHPRPKTGIELGVRDGDFESGSPSPFWFEKSMSFATPLCTVGTCGDGLGTAGPRGGDGWWAWFGGFPGEERSSLTQPLRLPDGDPLALELWLWHGAESGNGEDFLRIYLDDELLFELVDGDFAPTGGYRRVTVPLGVLPVQERYMLRIECKTAGPWASNFSIDDVAIRSRGVVDVPTLDSASLALLGLLLAAFAVRRLRRS